MNYVAQHRETQINRQFARLADRGPLRVLFVITSMPVGGAEMLLVNLLRNFDRQRIVPEVCCLKQLGPLGEQLQNEIPMHGRLLASKYDLRVLPRLIRLIDRRQFDAVITVGAGDKMFWGRLAAWFAGVPVVVSALHSTGWPDGVGRLNRLLTPLTDAFIGVARAHGKHLVENERFPAEKVHVIPNGVDVQRFRRCEQSRRRLRLQIGIPLDAPVCGIVAALRAVKNHLLFLRSAAAVKKQLPKAHFVLVGDGPERESLVKVTRETGIVECVHFLGNRNDVSDVLSTFDLFALTSHNEANPVSILEAMSSGLPVVSTNVGSVRETVQHGTTGLLAKSDAASDIAGQWLELLADPSRSAQMGRAGRHVVIQDWSLQHMVEGYQDLISDIYDRKCQMTSKKSVAGVAGRCIEIATDG